MNKTFKSTLSALSFFVLSACGGGGGGSSEPPPASTAPTSPAAQSNIKNVSTLGVAATATTGGPVAFDLGFISGLFAALGSDVGGTRVLSSPSCTAGTATTGVTKSASRTGLATGDQVTYTFDRCNLGSSGLVLNGKVVATAQGAVLPISAGNFSVDYAAVMTGFSATTSSSGLTRTYDGTLNISVSSVNLTQISLRFVVPAGPPFTLALTGLQTPISYIYGTGAAFSTVENSTAKTGTRKLDGGLTLRVSGAPLLTLVISTPTALLGTLSGNSFSATAGTINTTWVNENIATSTTYSGANATISGDTDKNGSLDLTFTIPAAELLAP